MTPATLHTLLRLLDGDALVRDRRGWHIGHPAGVGRELVNGTLALLLLGKGLVEMGETTPEWATYRITYLGRAALEETCADQTS